MKTTHPRLKRLTRLLAALLVAALAWSGTTISSSAAANEASGATGKPQPAKPTVVLVHGAFADSSGWAVVADQLIRDGYPVIAFSNPLRGITPDAAYLRAFLGTISGQLVLVGHSYGGAVITNAATGNPNVKSLVYIAAYALDEGETVASANTLGGGHTEVTDHLILRPFPGAATGDADAYIDPVHFPRLFAQDLPKRVTAVMAATQRPGALAALGTPSGPPAWKSIPSWYLVASQDRIIPPEAERAMATRARATTTEINSSHVAMMSHPQSVLRVIRAAAR